MKRRRSDSNLDDNQYLRSLGVDPAVVYDLASSLDMPFTADDVDQSLPDDESD